MSIHIFFLSVSGATIDKNFSIVLYHIQNMMRSIWKIKNVWNILYTYVTIDFSWSLVNNCNFCRGVQNKEFKYLLVGASFLTPNKTSATIELGNWYTQILRLNTYATTEEEGNRAVSESTSYSATNKISIGYESFLLPLFDDVPYADGSLMSDDQKQILAGKTSGHAFIWTYFGHPLSVTFTPTIAGEDNSVYSV